jgi:DNA-binding NtrC family response regulator
VLLVVRQQGNARVLAQAVEEAGLTPAHAPSASEIKRWLTGPEPPSVALVDTSGFGGDVWSLCHQLHENGIAFVVLAGSRDRTASSQSLACGAARVIEKPVAKEALLNLLQSLSPCGL